mmetsp:Transcript_13577/g.26602  ORF Transcript_13577/g.26602 Transcript_13577/m.26602 type:complete len:171 (-) Transcript_13577:250-762(-)
MPVRTRSKRKSSGGRKVGDEPSRKKPRPGEWSAREVKKWLSAIPCDSLDVRELADAVYKEGIDGQALPYVAWSNFGVEEKDDTEFLEQKVSELYGEAEVQADDVHQEWTVGGEPAAATSSSSSSSSSSSFMETAKLACPMYNDKAAWFLVVAAEVAVLSAIAGAIISSLR